MFKVKVFTAFSGYDSQCLALDRLHEQYPMFDYELVGWSEIDKYAIQAHNALYPQYADCNFGDISKIDWSSVPDFDLFTYSSPCQDFSNAGLQRGGEKGSGTRSSLLWECQRAIEAKKPKYCLLENVANLVSKKFVPLFNRWQSTLEKLGYRNFCCVMNAKDYGVPQNRKRVFLVSVMSDVPYTFPKPIELKKKLLSILEDDVDESYYVDAERLKGLLFSTQKQKEKGNGFAFCPKGEDDIANSITQNAGGRKTDNFIKVKTATKEGYDEIKEYPGCFDSSYPTSNTRRGRVQVGGGNSSNIND